MLKNLTTQQHNTFSSYAEKWSQYGLSTQPVNRERAASAIDEAYRCAGLEPPGEIIFMDSPLAAATKAVQHMHNERFLWINIQDDVRTGVKLKLQNKVSMQVWHLVQKHIEDPIRAVGEGTWNRIVEFGRGDVREDAVNPAVLSFIGRRWAGAGYNHYGHSWLAMYDFFLNEANMKFCSKLGGLMAAAMETGGFWPFENAAIVVGRPRSMKYDDRYRLHCEKGPAIEYADGWSVYVWHGVRVPEAWIMDKASLKPETALLWRNTEQRRAACEIVGWQKILELLNAQTINKDDDPQVGELLEVNIPQLGRERFLRVECGTGRVFALPVPPDMRTALQANAWTYGLTPNDYRPEIRT